MQSDHLQADVNWFCLRSQPKREHLAARYLASQWGIEVCLPRIAHRKKTVRGIIRFVEPLFPNYLFARFDLQTMLGAVRATGGVSGVVHFNGKFIPVEDSIIQEIVALSPNREIIEIEENPMPGDEIIIGEGSFSGLQGIIKSYQPAKMRVRVLLELLGRSTEVELPASSLLPAKRKLVLA